MAANRAAPAAHPRRREGTPTDHAHPTRRNASCASPGRLRGSFTLPWPWACSRSPDLPSAIDARSDRPHGNGSGQQRGALLVDFVAGVGDADATQALSSVGATEISRLDDLGTHVIDVPDALRSATLARLASDPRVVSVEEDATAEAAVVPTDPHWQQAWGPRKIGAPAAWNISTGRA